MPVTASEHYYPKTAHMFQEPDLVQQRSRKDPRKQNIAGFHICRKSKWLIFKERSLTNV